MQHDGGAAPDAADAPDARRPHASAPAGVRAAGGVEPAQVSSTPDAPWRAPETCRCNRRWCAPGSDLCRQCEREARGARRADRG